MCKWRIAACVIVIGMLLVSAGCGGSGSVNTVNLPASDPASGNTDAMSGSGAADAAGGAGGGGPGAVSDTDITTKPQSEDPAQGGTTP